MTAIFLAWFLSERETLILCLRTQTKLNGIAVNEKKFPATLNFVLDESEPKVVRFVLYFVYFD